MNHFPGWTRGALACALALVVAPAVAQEAAPAAPAAAPAEPASSEPAQKEATTLEGEAQDATVGGEAIVEGMVSEAEAAALAKKPWSVTASLGSGTGMMLLHPTQYVRSFYGTSALSLGVNGTYRIADKIVAGVQMGGQFELTSPNDPSGRRFWWSDPSLSINDQSLYKDRLTGINVTAGASLAFGLSPTSLYTTNILTFGLNAGVSRAFLDGHLSVALNLNGQGYLNRYSSPVVGKLAGDAVEMGVVRVGGAEDLGKTIAAAGGNNPLMASQAHLMLGYRITEKLGANAGFSLGRVWTDAGACDQFTPDVVDSNGNAVGKCGLSAQDMMSGMVGVGYQLDQRWSFNASLATGGRVFGYDRIDPQSPDSDLTQEVRRLRFPFWDPNLQGSSFSLGASATF